MSIGEHLVEERRGASVFSNEFQGLARPAAEVHHEGGHVRIEVMRRLNDRAVTIPLRENFPLYAADRAAQCFTVLDSQGRRAASAIRLRDFGLHVIFDAAPAAGDYFIHTNAPVGRA